MDKITLPDPSVAIATCPHCGAKVRPEPIWYERLVRIVQALNSLL